MDLYLSRRTSEVTQVRFTMLCAKRLHYAQHCQTTTNNVFVCKQLMFVGGLDLVTYCINYKPASNSN